MQQEERFETYIPKLEGWLDKNIYFYAGDLVETLFEKNIISFDDIENAYEQLKEEDYETKKEYEQALDDQEPQQVTQWFAVSEEAYDKFKMIGDPVIKFKELYIWGRTVYGQKICVDYYYQIDKLKVLLSIH